MNNRWTEEEIATKLVPKVGSSQLCYANGCWGLEIDRLNIVEAERPVQRGKQRVDGEMREVAARVVMQIVRDVEGLAGKRSKLNEGMELGKGEREALLADLRQAEWVWLEEWCEVGGLDVAAVERYLRPLAKVALQRGREVFGADELEGEGDVGYLE